MRFRCRIWFPLAITLFCGMLAGMILPTAVLLVLEGILLLFMLFCRICG